MIITGLLVTQLVCSALNWLRHPNARAWFWAVSIAFSVSVAGTILLFLAKLPQYRAGMPFRIGWRHLPPTSQRLYRISFYLITPSILALVALLLLVKRFC